MQEENKKNSEKNLGVHIEQDKKISESDPVKIDRMKLLTVLVCATLVLTLINTFGTFFNGSVPTGNVVREETQPADPTVVPTPSKVEIDTGDAPRKGGKNAPVQIIEFSDYECPFCGRAIPTIKQVEQEYEKKVEIVYMDFPLSFHPNAQKSAEAARCVRDQLGVEGYWKMHDTLFANQQTLSLENYKKWAVELGADAGKFETCLNSGKFASAVQSDFNKGTKAGVRGTPAFFINGKLISGAQPYEVFKSAIDAELNA